MRERVVVYVEREDGLLVFDHRDDSEAGTQVPAGGIEAGEDLADASSARPSKKPAFASRRSRRRSASTSISMDSANPPGATSFVRTPPRVSRALGSTW
jgi:hypothetical protein